MGSFVKAKRARAALKEAFFKRLSPPQKTSPDGCVGRRIILHRGQFCERSRRMKNDPHEGRDGSKFGGDDKQKM